MLCQHRTNAKWVKVAAGVLLLGGLLLVTTGWTEVEPAPTPKSPSGTVEEIRIDEHGITVKPEGKGKEKVSGKEQRDSTQAETGENSELATSQGDIVKIGESISIAEGVRVEGDVVAVGGSVDVDGEVNGDVVGVGGDVHVYPTGVITGDAVSVGGRVVKDPGGRVDGQTVSMGLGSLGGKSWAFPFLIPMGYWLNQFSRLVGFLVKLVWVAVLILLSVLAVALLTKPSEAIARTLDGRVWRAALIGLLGELLIAPLLLAMVISILGIPLIPVVVILIFAAFFMGFVGLSLRLGQVFQLGSFRARTPVPSAIVGGLLINGVWLLGSLIGVAGWVFGGIGGLVSFLGFLIAYVAWTIGFGAAIVSRSGTKPLSPPTSHTLPSPGQPVPARPEGSEQGQSQITP